MGDDRETQHTCRLGWLVDDIGTFLAGGVDTGAGEAADVGAGDEGDRADRELVQRLGREAVGRGAVEVNELLRSAYAAHEIVATELRLTGRRRGARRTVFADEPTPVALLLLCLRLCDAGDEVEIIQHTAGKGSTTRKACWPFGMAQAEELTRPPARDMALLPDLDA